MIAYVVAGLVALDASFGAGVWVGRKWGGKIAAAAKEAEDKARAIAAKVDEVEDKVEDVAKKAVDEVKAVEGAVSDHSASIAAALAAATK